MESFWIGAVVAVIVFMYIVFGSGGVSSIDKKKNTEEERTEQHNNGNVKEPVISFVRCVLDNPERFTLELGWDGKRTQHDLSSMNRHILGTTSLRSREYYVLIDNLLKKEYHFRVIGCYVDVKKEIGLDFLNMDEKIYLYNELVVRYNKVNSLWMDKQRIREEKREERLQKQQREYYTKLYKQEEK